MKVHTRASLSFIFGLMAALALYAAMSTSSQADSEIASKQDYASEKKVIAELSPGDSSAALAAVRAVRVRSALKSSLATAEINRNLANALSWLVHDYANSGGLRLLSAVPDGQSAGKPESSERLRVLQRTYWLQDNSLYGSGALLEYVPVLGRLLSMSWRSHWQQTFPNFCPDTQSDVVVGQLPTYERERSSADARCRLQTPSDWQYQRMRQYPDPADPGFDKLQTPIIGTDYPADDSGNVQLAAISKKSARDLLKYGCLRQVLLGHRDTAQQMFDLAMNSWDGNGFINAKNDPAKDGKLVGVYWTRDLAFALLCANALDLGEKPAFGNVTKSLIEQKLWAAQSPAGGVWSNYCADKGSNQSCRQGIPPIAKQTNEIIPLVLLAYGTNIWAPGQTR